MEGSEVVIRKVGDELVLTPIPSNRLKDLLASWKPLEDAMLDVADPPPQVRDDL